MSEKRFKINTSEIGHIYIDNPDGEHMTWRMMEDTLNQLLEENEQLKSENKNLKSKVDDLMDMELEDRDIVCMAGKFRLEEWGKHRLHQFYDIFSPLDCQDFKTGQRVEQPESGHI